MKNEEIRKEFIGKFATPNDFEELGRYADFFLSHREAELKGLIG